MDIDNLVAVVEAKRIEKSRLWDAVTATRRRLDAARDAGADVTQMTAAYSTLQQAHNTAVGALQDAEEAATLAKIRTPTATSTTTTTTTTPPSTPLCNISDEDLFLLSPHGAVHHAISNGADHEGQYTAKRLWYSRLSNHPKVKTTPQLPKRCWLGRILPRKVYGVGINFTKVVDKGVWEMCGDPEEATVVWERDQLKEFREKFDPRSQVLNRMVFAVEAALSDKAELVRGFSDDSSNPFLETVLLTTPQEFLSFARTVGEKSNNKFSGIWILKRANLASGFGLQIIENVEQHFSHKQNLAALMATMQQKRHKYVLQRYLRNPLLIKLTSERDCVGRKFDLRCYFVVVSADPLIIHFAEGVARLNIAEYEPKDYHNPHIHISNIAQQRTHINYARLQSSLKIKHSELGSYIGENVLKKVTARMKTALKAVFMNKQRAGVFREAGESRTQLMAADFLVDTDAGVHLLELQTGVALSIDDPVSKAHIPDLINATLEVAYRALQRRVNGEALTGLPAEGFFEVLVDQA